METDGRQYQAINRAALKECEARLEARDREIEELRTRAQRAEAECERLESYVLQRMERIGELMRQGNVHMALAKVNADISALSTPPPDGEPEKCQTCYGEGVVTPDGPNGESHYALCPDCQPAPQPPEQAHGDALAALEALKSWADARAAESDDPALHHSNIGHWVRTIRRHLTASGVSYAPEEVRRLPNELKRHMEACCRTNQDDKAQAFGVAIEIVQRALGMKNDE